MKRLTFIMQCTALLIPFCCVGTAIEIAVLDKADHELAKGIIGLPRDIQKLLGLFAGVSYYHKLQPITFSGGHANKVTSISFNSSFSKAVTVASCDSVASVWDTRSGRLLQQLCTHNADSFCSLLAKVKIYIDRQYIFRKSHISTALFSADDKQVITGAWDGAVRFWSSETGELLRKWSCHRDLVSSLHFCCSDQLMITTSRDKMACVWHVPTGLSLFRFVNHPEGCMKAEISKSADFMLTQDYLEKYYLWKLDVKKGSFSRVAIDFEKYTKKVEFNNADTKVIAWNGRKVKKWDLSTGRWEPEYIDFLARSFSRKSEDELLHSQRAATVTVWDRRVHRPVYKFLGDGGQIIHSSNDPLGIPVFVTQSDDGCRVYKSGKHFSKILQETV